VELGSLIRRRREEYDITISKLARHVGWGRQRLANLEDGKAISTDVRAWVLMSERLGFERRYLLSLAWGIAKKPFHLRLPSPDDPLRERILNLIIEQQASDLPSLP
jgi:transcriptional regulator with XRE-family HTH domain